MDYQLSDFKVGQRVQTHPATDYWMRGARYGTVTLIGRQYVTVNLDAYGNIHGERTFHPANLIPLEDS